MITENDVWIVPGIVVKGNRIMAPGIILEDMDPLFGKDDSFDYDDYDDGFEDYDEAVQQSERAP